MWIPDAAWLAAAAGFVTALTAAILAMWREIRANTKATLHNTELSNAQHDRAMARIQQLGNAMVDGGLPVPNDPGIVAQRDPQVP